MAMQLSIIVKRWKPPQCLRVDKQNEALLSNQRRTGHEWMNSKDMLSQRSQIPKDYILRFYFRKCPEQTNVETESRLEVA